MVCKVYIRTVMSEKRKLYSAGKPPSCTRCLLSRRLAKTEKKRKDRSASFRQAVSTTMASRFETDTDHLQHLTLDRVEDATSHAKVALDVAHALVDPTADDRPPDFAPPEPDDRHSDRDEPKAPREDHDDASKPDVLGVPPDPDSAPGDEHDVPSHRADSAADHLAHVQEDVVHAVHGEVVADDTPHHAVMPALVDGHVDAVSLAVPVSAAHPAHLTVIMPPGQMAHMASQAVEQPIKKKRKTYSNEEERRKARILKNRRTAEESRQRRMKKMKDLEEFAASSQVREKELQEETRILRVQIQTLEQMVNEKDAIIAQKDAEIQRFREKLHMKQT